MPFSSELVLVALVKLGLPPIACLISATLGNTVGGMTCYYMGRLGKISWIEKYFKVKKEKVDKMVKFLQGKGALMAFFTFLPAIGEVIAIALGFMRSNTWLTIVSMFVGKLIRYILLLYALESAWAVSYTHLANSSCGLFILLLLLYRSGKYSVPTVHHPLGALRCV